MWPALFNAIKAFAPRPLLTTSGSPAQHPYTSVSYYTSPALGWADFAQDEVPAWDDPRLAWIMRLMVLESVPCVLVSRTDRLYASFCIWLKEEHLIEGDTEHQQWQAFQDTLFYNQAPFPEAFHFLDSPGYRSYLAPAQVHRLAQLERDHGLLHSAMDRIGHRGLDRFAAQEFGRLAAFLEFAVADGAALLYHEPAS